MLLDKPVVCGPVNPGAIVSCEVYGFFDHSAVVVDHESIVELHGSGLVRRVSYQRFIQQRSGEHFMVACSATSTPLRQRPEETVKRALEWVFHLRGYDPLSNNCHRFTWHCLTGRDEPLTTFAEFNQHLRQHFQQTVSWCRWEALSERSI